MNYWLHPEAQQDLREAAEFYREQAGAALSQSFLAEFEHSVDLLYSILASARSGATVDVVSLHGAFRSASSTQ